MNETHTSYRSMFVGGLATASARALKQIIQLAVFLVGARFLGPAEFGLFALVSAGAMLALMVAQAGSQGFVLSYRGAEADLRQVLTIGGTLSLAVAVFGLLAAFILTALSSESEVALLVGLFAVWILVAGYLDVHIALLLRSGRLTANALIEIAAELAGLAVAVVLLRNGFGAASLVYARILAQALQLGLSIVLTRAWPALAVSPDLLRDYRIFSTHVLATRGLGNLRMSLGSFLIGGFLGVAAVGLFRLAQRLTGAVYELLFEPVRAVSWVLLRRHAGSQAPGGDGHASLQAALDWLVPLILAVAAPMFLGLAVLAEPILVLLLGEAWRPAAPIVAILSVGMIFVVPAALTEPLLGLTGKMRFLPRVSVFNLVVAIVLIVAACQFDVLAVAWAQAASFAIGFLTTLWLHCRVLGLDWRLIGRRVGAITGVAVATALAATLIRDAANAASLGPAMTVLATTLPAAAIYLAGVTLVLFHDIQAVLRSFGKRRGEDPRLREGSLQA